MKVRFCAILCLFALSACGHKLTTVRKNPSFEQESFRNSHVAVLPADAEVKEVSLFGGSKRMEEYEYYIENIIGESIRSYLKSKNCNAVYLNRKEIYDSKISGKILDIKQRYNESAGDLYKQNLMEIEKAFAIETNIGSVNLEYSSKKPEYFIISNYFSHSQSSGARTAMVMGALLGGRAGLAEQDSLLIGIVDNQTGSISWANRGITGADVIGDSISRMGKSDQEVDRVKIDKIVKLTLDPIFEPDKN